MVTHLPAHHNPAGKKQECRNKLYLLYCGKILQYGKQNARSDSKGWNGRRMRKDQRPISGRVG